jgi:non-ribosomal peptide synthetase component F
VEELRPERDLSRNPLVQVLFALQNVTRSALKLEGLTLEPLRVDTGTTKFDLSLFINESSEGLKGAIEYDTDLFDPSSISRMLTHFETLLEASVTSPDQPVSTLPMLTRPEFHQILTQWNDTQADYPHNICLHSSRAHA